MEDTVSWSSRSVGSSYLLWVACAVILQREPYLAAPVAPVLLSSLCCCCCVLFVWLGLCSVEYRVHVQQASLSRLQHSRATERLQAHLLRSAWWQWQRAQQVALAARATADLFQRGWLSRASLIQWLSGATRRRSQRARYASRVKLRRAERMHAFHPSHWRREEGTHRMAEEWKKHRTLVAAMCAWWQWMAQQSRCDAAALQSGGEKMSR